MRKTKIVCTIGPASVKSEILPKLVEAGMNVARLNFSHGSHDYHKNTIDAVKDIRKKMNTPIAIMLDTKGPEIRTKTLKEKDKKVFLEKGKTFTLTTREIEGDENIVSITYKQLPEQLSEGKVILIDDGAMGLVVKEITQTDIICEVTRAGYLGEKKGINIPSTRLDMPYLSETDKQDLIFGIENDIDFVAASFVRTEDDVISLRNFINYHGGHDIGIISKIENLEGIDNFDDILKHSDGIMVARGDMGVEVDFERLPGIQKRFIKKCYQSGKMVITATQMLESMIKSPVPTRAEITDVANAVFDGTSAVMLSGETAMGDFPVEAVKVMAKVARQAEEDAFDMDSYKDMHHDIDETDTTNAVCDAACTTARDINAKAIIAVTKSGQTARRMSKFRPAEPIVAATPLEKTYNKLALSWGVYPIMSCYQTTSDDLFLHAVDCAKMLNVVKRGDRVVIIAGVPLATVGNTNILKVEIVGQRH